jgi:hypothetical protein
LAGDRKSPTKSLAKTTAYLGRGILGSGIVGGMNLKFISLDHTEVELESNFAAPSFGVFKMKLPSSCISARVSMLIASSLVTCVNKSELDANGWSLTRALAPLT